MKSYTHPNQQRVLWPDDRSDKQWAAINEQNLGELPDDLDHPDVAFGEYIGIPGETTVYEVTLTPDTMSPSVPSTWLLSIREQGWDVVTVYLGSTGYKGRLRFHLGQLPLVGQFFGKDALKVRVQHSEEREQGPPQTPRPTLSHPE